MRGIRKSFDAVIQRRISWVLLFFLAAFFLLSGRLFILQVLHYREYEALAAKQHKVSQDLLPERGIIFAQDKEGNLIPLALNKTQKTLIAVPKIIKNPDEAADLLEKELHLDKQEILSKLSKKEDSYEIVAKKIDLKTAQDLEAKLPEGFVFEDEKRRVYPHGTTASRIIGFASVGDQEEKGRYGVEKAYNEDLSGSRGFFEGAKDAAGFWVALGRRIMNPPKNGSSVVLTIDYNIQAKSEDILLSVAKKWSPVSGSILVLEPRTGRILANAHAPAFDLNEFSKVKDFSIFLNPLAEAMYEFGSVIKPITMAAGIEERLVKPETTYEDKGEVKIGGYTIKNFDLKAHKVQTMTQVLEKSLNTGVVYVAGLLGQERQKEYLERFGFGRKTNIDLPGEVPGNISNLNAGREIDYATASFGQGIAVTPIQLASAIGAIANEGKLMRPYVVEKITDDANNIFETKPEVAGEPVSKETSETITKMLVSAVKSGFENRAGVKGYFVAGKTGTAQIPRKDGRGYSDKVIHTFVGYAPAFDPRFLVLIQLNEPQGNRFAANTLTPAFHDLAEFILNYYEVPPDEVSQK